MGDALSMSGSGRKLRDLALKATREVRKKNSLKTKQTIWKNKIVRGFQAKLKKKAGGVGVCALWAKDEASLKLASRW